MDPLSSAYRNRIRELEEELRRAREGSAMNIELLNKAESRAKKLEQENTRLREAVEWAKDRLSQATVMSMSTYYVDAVIETLDELNRRVPLPPREGEDLIEDCIRASGQPKETVDSLVKLHRKGKGRRGDV